MCHIKFVEVLKPQVLHLVVGTGLDCELAHGKICETAAFFLKDMRKLGECFPLWLIRVISEKWDMELCYPPQPEGVKPQSLCLQTVFELPALEFSGIDHTPRDTALQELISLALFASWTSSFGRQVAWHPGGCPCPAWWEIQAWELSLKRKLYLRHPVSACFSW